MRKTEKGYYYQQEDNNIYEKVPKRKRKDYCRNRFLGTFILCLFFIVIVIGNVSFQQKLKKSGGIQAIVIRVVDGDTLILHMNGRDERVRLIGVDSPESVSEVKEENTIYGVYASDFTKKELIQGMLVYVTYDKEKTDQYGRSLVYVWTDKEVGNLDFLYQKKLVEEGYAFAISYEPNTLYATELYDAMGSAMEEKKGLWSYDTFYEEYADSNYP